MIIIIINNNKNIVLDFISKKFSPLLMLLAILVGSLPTTSFISFQMKTIWKRSYSSPIILLIENTNAQAQNK